MDHIYLLLQASKKVLFSVSRPNDLSVDFTTYKKKEHTYKRRTRRKRPMLYMFGIIIGLIFIIYCFSNGLKEQKNALVGKCQGRGGLPQSSESLSNKKKKDLSDEDFHLLAKILSVGLVDADPNYLHHLKGYRDLRGAST